MSKAKRLSRVNKKAVLGIETLIIFIAMILVAGVASTVLIRTSGLLQQRALAVSNEAISRVGTGFEFIQVIGNVNTTSETAEEFECLMRLAAGSQTIQMNNVGLTYVSESISFNAHLSHINAPDFESVEVDYLDNHSDIALYNLDYDLDDDEADSFKIIWNYSGGIYEFFNFTLYQ